MERGCDRFFGTGKGGVMTFEDTLSQAVAILHRQGRLTYQALQLQFHLDDTGSHTLRGVAEPMSVYRVLGERLVESRFEAASTGRLTRLVGRREEVNLIFHRWEQAKAGKGQVVLLCGEPGIGKSRLMQTIGETRRL